MVIDWGGLGPQQNQAWSIWLAARLPVQPARCINGNRRVKTWTRARRS